MKINPMQPQPYVRRAERVAAPRPAPSPDTFERTELGWVFSRPVEGCFTPAEYPDYWTAHLAQLSSVVYLPEQRVQFVLLPRGCTSVQWFDRGSTQAVGYVHEGHACLVFRGTQELVDWRVDATCILYGSPGRHLGFHLAWKAVEARVKLWLALVPEYKGLCIAGHSLGGALAVVSALELCGAGFTVACVRTFGCPRVGSIEFALVYRQHLLGVTQQYKYGTDAVTILPPVPFFVPVSLAHKIATQEPIPGMFDPVGSPEKVSFWTVLSNIVESYMGMYGGPTARSSRRAQEPLAVILGLLVLAIFYANLPHYLLSHGRAWANHVGHTRSSAALLAGVGVLLVEQLSYLVPVRIHSALRWVLALAAILGPASLHLHLLWIVPWCVVTGVWVFIAVVVLLRLMEPSTVDHTMDGYLYNLPMEESSYARRAAMSAGRFVQWRNAGNSLIDPGKKRGH